MLSLFFRIYKHNYSHNFVNYYLCYVFSVFFLHFLSIPILLHHFREIAYSKQFTGFHHTDRLFIKQMACCPVSRLMLLELRCLLFTLLCRIWTSGVETTSAWRVHRTWHISLKDDPLSCTAQLRIRYRNCREKCLCVRMDRVAVQLIALTKLYQRSQIHNTDSVGDMTYN